MDVLVLQSLVPIHQAQKSRFVTIKMLQIRIFKVDTPVLDFPFADFPELKYPLENSVEENKAEETRVLDQVRQIIRSRKTEGNSISDKIQ